MVEGLAGLGQAVAAPLALDQRPKQRRGLVPAGGEDDVAHVLAPGALHMRLAADGVPRLAVPLEQAGALFAVFIEAVVGHHHPLLAGEAALEMGALGDLGLLDNVGEQRGLQCAHVQIEEQPFHGEHIDAVCGVGQMAHGGGEAVVLQRLDEAKVALGINGVGADEGLAGLAVEQAVGVGAVAHVHALDLQALVDAVEAQSGAGLVCVGVVGDRPERVGPGHQRPDARLRARRPRVGFHAHVGKPGQVALCSRQRRPGQGGDGASPADVHGMHLLKGGG